MKKIIMFSALFLLLFLSIINVQQQSMYSEESRPPGWWVPSNCVSGYDSNGYYWWYFECQCEEHPVKYCAVGVPKMNTSNGTYCSDYNY